MFIKPLVAHPVSFYYFIQTSLFPTRAPCRSISIRASSASNVNKVTAKALLGLVNVSPIHPPISFLCSKCIYQLCRNFYSSFPSQTPARSTTSFHTFCTFCLQHVTIMWPSTFARIDNSGGDNLSNPWDRFFNPTTRSVRLPFVLIASFFVFHCTIREQRQLRTPHRHLEHIQGGPICRCTRCPFVFPLRSSRTSLGYPMLVVVTAISLDDAFQVVRIQSATSTRNTIGQCVASTFSSHMVRAMT